jgi:hypothetical protein
MHSFRPADHHLQAQELLAAMMDDTSAFAAGNVQFILNDCFHFATFIIQG